MQKVEVNSWQLKVERQQLGMKGETCEVCGKSNDYAIQNSEMKYRTLGIGSGNGK